MKRWIFSGVLATLIAVTGFAFADAQGRGQRGPGLIRGGPGGFGHFARMADLSDEQRKQVQAVFEEHRASREQGRAAMDLHRQLQAELLADVPDEQKIDTLRRQLVEAQGEALTAQIALQRKLVQILTPEQRAKARERLAESPRNRMRGEAAPGGLR
jgi:Spy/CpxP family protein refolding chaperone